MVPYSTIMVCYIGPYSRIYNGHIKFRKLIILDLRFEFSDPNSLKSKFEMNKKIYKNFWNFKSSSYSLYHLNFSEFGIFYYSFEFRN